MLENLAWTVGADAHEGALFVREQFEAQRVFLRRFQDHFGFPSSILSVLARIIHPKAGSSLR